MRIEEERSDELRTTKLVRLLNAAIILTKSPNLFRDSPRSSQTAEEHKQLLKRAKETGDMTIAYGPPRHWRKKAPPGTTEEEHATMLRNKAIFVSDMFGLFMIAMTGLIVGICAHIGELHSIFKEPGGIVGIVFGSLGLLIFVVPRFAEFTARKQGKLPPLYG